MYQSFLYHYYWYLKAHFRKYKTLQVVQLGSLKYVSKALYFLFGTEQLINETLFIFNDYINYVRVPTN